MQSFLFLVFVVNGSELAEMDHLHVLFASSSSFTQLSLKHFHESEATLLILLDPILLLHEGNITKFIGCHHEAQTLSGTGNSSRATNTIHILLDLTGQIPLQDPVDAFEVETTRCHISANEQA